MSHSAKRSAILAISLARSRFVSPWSWRMTARVALQSHSCFFSPQNLIFLGPHYVATSLNISLKKSIFGLGNPSLFSFFPPFFFLLFFLLFIFRFFFIFFIFFFFSFLLSFFLYFHMFFSFFFSFLFFFFLFSFFCLCLTIHIATALHLLLSVFFSRR